MIVNKYFKEQIKTKSISPKSCSEHTTSRILKKTCAHSKHILTIGSLSMIFLSGCSTVGQKLASAADVIARDVQTQHDENFRIKRVRKALCAGDIPGAEEHRDTLHASHWRSIANIEIATAKYIAEKEQALEIVSKTTEEIWNIADADNRAMALLALLSFELGTKKDIPAAKETIKQTKQTIAFILDNDYQHMRRQSELQTLIKTHNHLLSR